jgi:ribonuclease-3
VETPELTTDPSPDPRTNLGNDRDSSLEEVLGYVFTRPELLVKALTHRSYSNERGDEMNYERLEFLGDAVFGLVTSHWLFELYPDQPEGELAKLKGFLVSAPVLAHHADTIDVGERLLLGVGEQRSGGSAKASILADAMEALFGAIYIDGGYEAVRPVIEPILENALQNRSRYRNVDAKTALQEYAQGRKLGLPHYRLTEESGPDHHKLFTVDCCLAGEVVGSAAGHSKKLAEQGAAATALVTLDLAPDEP